MSSELRGEKLGKYLKTREVDLEKTNEELSELDQSLEERFKLESLLAELSARFINLPVDRIDNEIEDAQRRICEHLDLDRSTLWQIREEDSEALLLTHLYQPPEIPTPPEHLNARDFFPWSVQKVLSGDLLVISKLTDLPSEAGLDLESYRLYGTKSNVLVPLSVGGGPVFGLLTFAVTREETKWPKAVLKEFRLIAEVFSNALARRQSEKALRESKARLTLATNAAGAGLWSMEVDTDAIWASEKARELFHVAPNEEVNYESFLKLVYSEDRELIKQAVRQALQAGESLVCDYRIVLPDGNIRWIGARGQLHPRLAGESDCLMGVNFDISDRKLAEKKLKERLQFEELLTEISTRFINQTPDGIDREIENAQRRVCEFLGIDLAAVWQWLPDSAPDVVTLTHFYRADEGPRLEDRIIAQEYFPWAQKQVRAGRIVNVSSMEELPVEAARDLELCRYLGIKSNLTIPLSVGGAPPIGAFGLNSTRGERTWPEEIVRKVQLVAQAFTNALERKRMEGQLLGRLRKIEALSKHLENENLYLQKEIRRVQGFGKIIGSSAALNYVLFRAKQVASTDATVLLLGETGTGKGMVANAIHSLSPRKDRAMITVNCAALPANLIESELFGREKGAFTGAHARQSGRFEVADGGTIFLDEIGDLPLELQSKLLRVLQDGEFERLGSAKTVKVDVRLIASTNRDLKAEMQSGRFREDLFYRLNVFPVSIPALKERAEDIPQLVHFFVDRYSRKFGRQIKTIPKATIKMLQKYSWPGNVRELEHLVERAVITTSGPVLQMKERLEPLRVNEVADASLKDLASIEREHIQRVLHETGGKIQGPKGAASILNLNSSTLRFRIKKLGIKRP